MFRSLGKSKIALVLAILFGVSLLFFKSGSRYSNFFNSDSIVASVSGTPISNTKFLRTMKMNIDNFSKIFGKELSGEEIRSFNIQNLALNALISNAVFENEFDQINFKIDEKIIAQKTKERIPQLYDSDNKLNDLYLKSFLNQQGLKIEDIVQIINFETRDNYFNKSFFEINYPQIFSNKINAYSQHKRNITYLELDINNISIDEIMNGNTLDDNLIEIQKYYDQNISNYLSEEKRDIEYLVIDKALIKKGFIPSSTEVEEYFENNSELFLVEEKRSFIQLNFKSIENAKDFKESTKNLNISQLIEFAKTKNIKFNEFKNLQSNEILDEISLPLFELKINDQSEIIETAIAKHIVILKSINQAYQPNLNEVKEEIISLITDIDTDNYFKDLSENISNDIIDGKKLEEIANDHNIVIKTIDNLTKNFKFSKKHNKEILSDLVQKSFKSNKDFISDVINLNKNLHYVFNVLKIKSPQPLIFVDIKNEVFEDWKYIKKTEKITNELENTTNKNEYIKTLSDINKVKLKKITVAQNADEVPSTLINKIFKEDINQIVYYINNDKIHISTIDRVLVSNKFDNEENIIPLQNDLKSSFGEELIQKKKIKINEALISALIDRY